MKFGDIFLEQWLKLDLISIENMRGPDFFKQNDLWLGSNQVFGDCWIRIKIIIRFLKYLLSPLTII
jgi:hypothetical protein